MNWKLRLLRLLPLNLYLYLRDQRRKPTFAELFQNYQRSMHQTAVRPLISLHKNIISVQGLGYSGSGAVLDYLREFDNIEVYGDSDKEGSKVIVNKRYGEAQLLKQAGGLFEIERFLGCKNTFLNDALLRRFIMLTESSELYKHSDEAKEAFFDFLTRITDGVFFNEKIYHNGHLYNLESSSPMSYLKDMTTKEFRFISREFLTRLFNALHVEGRASIAFDQLLQDEYNFQKNLDYIPNLKQIIVYRDPRDVYTYGVQNDIEWIHHHGDVGMFVHWYKTIRLNNLDLTGSKGYLVIRFEELVSDYKNQVLRINDYLGIDESHHVSPLSYFDPEISKRGIGIYKNSAVQRVKFKLIERELGDYCWQL